jgi:hypothetical protein
MRAFIRAVIKPSLRALSSVEAAQQHLWLLGRFVPTPPRGIETIAVDGGGVRAERITAPASRHDRYLLYLHGGSYLVGWPGLYRDLTWRLATVCRARVLCIDYRLTPEHPFRAAVDDAAADPLIPIELRHERSRFASRALTRIIRMHLPFTAIWLAYLQRSSGRRRRYATRRCGAADDVINSRPLTELKKLLKR